MKVGLVRRGYSASGGAERYLIRFAAGLEDAGHSCVLFTDREWPDDAWADREQIVLPSGDSPAAFATALEKADPRSRCDFLFSLERVWHCDCYRAGDGVHAAWLRRRASIDPAWTRFLPPLLPKHREILRIERALYGAHSPAHIIANSQMVKDEMIRHYRTDPVRIDIVPNGFDSPALDPAQIERFRSLGRRSYGIGPDTIAFLFVGSGWKRKGLRHAVAAVETLARRGLDVRLYVAGKDRRRPKSRAKGVVEYLGAMAPTELTQLYELADVFLLPTRYDPFSNACLEAAAHGLPVITTTSNGIADLADEMEGTIVEDPTSEELVEACESWLDPARRAAARPLNREFAASYSVARNVEKTLACFDRILSIREKLGRQTSSQA